MNATEKLLKAVFQISELKQGEVQVNSEGEKYRYDLYVTKYPTTYNWIAQLFERAARENGAAHQARFEYNGLFLSFDRQKFIGTAHGKIRVQKLVIL